MNENDKQAFEAARAKNEGCSNNFQFGFSRGWKAALEYARWQQEPVATLFGTLPVYDIESKADSLLRLTDEELNLLWKRNVLDPLRADLEFAHAIMDAMQSKAPAAPTIDECEHEIRLVRARNERLEAEVRELMEKALDHLVNLQPHIPNACRPGHEPFIDSHVDMAMRYLKDALAKQGGGV